ncbi:thioesterase [Streptomyces sp. DSM 15324]|nr:thioesterase [Streptomyces sp. DSM 15324]
MHLICFSYAGGTHSVYRDWAEHLDPGTQVVPVLLPGRALRRREKPYTVLRQLVSDLTEALLDHRLTRNYALFGHSMGALLAYEVACALREGGEPEPRHLFVSGSRAPQLYGDRSRHVLDDAGLRRLVQGLGGLGEDPEIGSVFLQGRLPVLRADLAVCDTYRWTPRLPLSCPMTAFSGTDDPIAPAYEVEAWRAYTTGSLLHRRLEGDHFFLHGPAIPLLLRAVRSELGSLREPAGAGRM